MSYATFSVMCIGMIAMMCLYMFCRSFLSNDKAYRYYAAYHFCFTLYFSFKRFDTEIVGFFGMPQRGIDPKADYFSIITTFYVMLITIFYMFFVSNFLSLQRLIPKVYRVFKWSIYLMYFCCIGTLIVLCIPPLHFLVRLGHNAVGVYVLGASVYAIWQTALLNNRLSNYFVYGTSAYLLGIGLSFYASNFTLWGRDMEENMQHLFHLVPLSYAYLGVITETLFFAVGLSYKVFLSESEKRKLQETFNTQLKTEVQERTAEIIELKQQQFYFETQQALEQERTRLARDMHDDISSGLSAINLLANYIKNTPLSTDTHLEIKHIAESSTELNQRIREIIWAVSSDSDNIEGLVHFLKRYVSEFGDMQHIDTQFIAPDNLPDLKLSNEVKRNLFLCVKEALNNTAKYAKATLIEVSIDVEEHNMALTIKDYGIGFDLETALKNGGNGLKNMRERMAQVGGDAVISTKNGCQVVLRLKI